MKYCDKCNVGIHKDLITCPLCGKHAEEFKDNYFEKYADEIEPKTNCEKIAVISTREKFLTRFFFTCLLLVISLSVVVDLLYFKSIVVAHYIGGGALLAYVNIFLPIAKGRRLHSNIIINVIILSVFAMLIDLFMPDGWSGFTFTYSLPIISVAMLAVIDFRIVVKSKAVKEYFVNLYFVTAVAIAAKIILWALPDYKFDILSTIAFFASIINAAIISVIYSPLIKEEFSRQFFIDGR